MVARPKPAPVPGLLDDTPRAVRALGTRPSPEQIMEWLDEVPDPEIPVISLIDLGIIRGLAWSGDTLEVTVTPTYSGCPATMAISLSIETELAARGVPNVRLIQKISPPWTTDWLSDKGREKLEAFGIAPPQPAGGPSHCPHCQSKAVERVSQFGSTPCKAQWRCTDCLEPFDYFKCI